MSKQASHAIHSPAVSSIHFLLTDWNFGQVTLDFESDELWCLGIRRPRQAGRTYNMSSNSHRVWGTIWPLYNLIIRRYSLVSSHYRALKILGNIKHLLYGSIHNCPMSTASTSELWLADFTEMWCNICISELGLELSYSRFMMCFGSMA